MNKEFRPATNGQYQINKESYEPAYLQLANILRRQISEGLFFPGGLLPSEAQLVRRYGISPMTVRRSINLLSDQGVVSTEQGRGTYVRPLELSSAIFDLQELQDLVEHGTAADVKLLDVRIISAVENTARKLDIPVGTPTIYLRRLFKQDGQPIFYHRAYLIYDPTRPIVEAEMDVTSLKGLFSHSDSTLLKRGQLTIDSILMNAEEAELLQTSLPAAAFNLEHLFYDFNDRPVSWGWFIFRSDRLHFTTRLGLNL
ncbi:MAG: hypothetical protein CVU39_22805 [Chloroflexi bacterium HGW-Chloroflexi-10]|nr:MAG: hypothetical protein CVU39_22805 [Chloroflexi bacterium HGW-Chloroflexi-10]